MCTKQKTALEIIELQKDKSGLSDDAIFLARKQCEDMENMDKRMTNIENKVDNISKDVSEIKDMLVKKNSFLENLKEIINNKVFIYILFTLIAISCGLPIAQTGLLLFK